MRDLKVLAVAGLAAAALAITTPAPAEEAVFIMHKIDGKGIGPEIGRITVRDSPQGMVLEADLRDLPPGEHGFHFHETADCRPSIVDGKPLAAGRSGDHFDPDRTGKHLGPTGNGHRGDLPLLVVDSDGSVEGPVTAPRLKVSQVRDLALVIHAESDNFSDVPEPLGGSGGRIA
ncbi:MAG TPA: superoxide dismutase family protein [Alphaproteobacteria bacterium]